MVEEAKTSGVDLKALKVQEETVRAATGSDQPTKRDLLGFEPYVEAIAQFLMSPGTTPPLALSIEGEWGTGKSSFMRQLEKAIQRETAELEKKGSSEEDKSADRRNRSKKRQALTVWFNPWRHDKEDSLWAAFALKFISDIRSKLSPIERLRSFIALFRLRFQWSSGWLDALRISASLLAFVFLIVSFVILLVLRGPEWLTEILELTENRALWEILLGVPTGLTGIAGVIALIAVLCKKGIDLIGNPLEINLKKHIKAPNYKEHIAFVEHFHEDFEKIVNAYSSDRRVYVFIDDLDRCEVPKAADLMQALNLMIGNNPRIIFVIGMDREKVAAGLAVKYQKLVPYLYRSSEQKNADLETLGLHYGWNFIRKFVQLPFTVPEASELKIKNFLDHLGREDKTGMPEKPLSLKLYLNPLKWLKDFVRFLRKVFQKKPTVSQGVSPETPPAKSERKEPNLELNRRHERIKLLLGSDSEHVKRITLMMAPTFNNNPRQIIQFINLFRLQAFIANETGLFDQLSGMPVKECLSLEQLGKFIVLELRWPTLMIDIGRDKELLTELQKIALGEQTKARDGTQEHWITQPGLADFLRVGCIDEQGNVDSSLRDKYSLENLDIELLLRVSPKPDPSEYITPEDKDAKRETKPKLDLELILLDHQQWLESGGKKGKQADLNGADLSKAKLRGAKLRGAKLSGANLSGVDLSGARLRGATLRGATLRGADLSGAHLIGVDLSLANFRAVNLREANLRQADLRRAKNLTVEQFSKVRTLYLAKLNQELMKQIKNKYPYLLEKPKPENLKIAVEENIAVEEAARARKGKMKEKIGVIMTIFVSRQAGKETAFINSMSLSPRDFNGRVRFGIVGRNEEFTFEELAEEIKGIRFSRGKKLFLFVLNKETRKRKDFGFDLLKDLPEGDILEKKEIYEITEHLKDIGIL